MSVLGTAGAKRSNVMPKKIPNCAHCGVSLKEKKLGSGATVMLDYREAIGKPMIGWHESCWDDDDITDCAQGCIGGQNMGPPMHP